MEYHYMTGQWWKSCILILFSFSCLLFPFLFCYPFRFGDLNAAKVTWIHSFLSVLSFFIFLPSFLFMLSFHHSFSFPLSLSSLFILSFHFYFRFFSSILSCPEKRNDSRHGMEKEAKIQPQAKREREQGKSERVFPLWQCSNLHPSIRDIQEERHRRVCTHGRHILNRWLFLLSLLHI